MSGLAITLIMMPPAIPPRKPFGDLSMLCEMRSAGGEITPVKLELKSANAGGRSGYFWSVISDSTDYPAVPSGPGSFASDDPQTRVSNQIVARDGYTFEYVLSFDGLSRGDVVEKFGPNGHLTVYRRARYYQTEPVGIGFCQNQQGAIQ